LQAANDLQGESNSKNEAAFHDALQAVLRQEQQRLQNQFGKAAPMIYHGEWNVGTRATLKLNSQRDETFAANLKLDAGRIAIIVVDLSCTNAQWSLHGKLTITMKDGGDESWHGSKVMLYRSDGKTDYTTLDKNGEFSFQLLGAGSFGVEILSQHHEVLQLGDITVEP
jgi:hypothetical protein